MEFLPSFLRRHLAGKLWWCCEWWAVLLGYLSSSLWETDAQIFISFRFSWMPKRYYRWGGVVPYSWREQGYQTLSEWGSRYVKEITNHSGYQRLSFLMIWNSRSGPAGVLLDCIHISFSYVSILAVNDSQNSLGLQSMRWYWWSRHERLPVISFLSPQHV